VTGTRGLIAPLLLVLLSVLRRLREVLAEVPTFPRRLCRELPAM
jgi:hypothetical protein